MTTYVQAPWPAHETPDEYGQRLLDAGWVTVEPHYLWHHDGIDGGPFTYSEAMIRGGLA